MILRLTCRAARNAAALALSLLAAAVRAAPPADASTVAARACMAIDTRVEAVSADAMLLNSYERGSESALEPALRSAAFTYDNALAVVALLACGRREAALRVGEALRRAAQSGPRLRNAYRAGPAGDAPLPNGWWDAAANSWVEDAYQDGSATGNVAWAALALLALYDTTHEPSWLDGARRLAEWTVANTADARGAGGFTGGIYGFDAAPQALAWKSTEHNIDLAALFARLAAARVAGDWQHGCTVARYFVESQWDREAGRFLVGTQPDGVTPNRQTSALDVQLWPLLLPDAPRDWRRALAYAEREHGVRGGFDFNADRDGLWLEGTAQAALVYRRLGRDRDADALLATIAREISSGGYVYATREPRVTTGLALSGASTSADFYYYRRPHLGATAWAVLAATGWNPFASAGK